MIAAGDHHVRVGQPIADLAPVAVGLDEAGGPQHREVLRDVRLAQAELARPGGRPRTARRRAGAGSRAVAGWRGSCRTSAWRIVISSMAQASTHAHLRISAAGHRDGGPFGPPSRAAAGPRAPPRTRPMALSRPDRHRRRDAVGLEVRHDRSDRRRGARAGSPPRSTAISRSGWRTSTRPSNDRTELGSDRALGAPPPRPGLARTRAQAAPGLGGHAGSTRSSTRSPGRRGPPSPALRAPPDRGGDRRARDRLGALARALDAAHGCRGRRST